MGVKGRWLQLPKQPETTREKFRNKLRQGKLEDRMVEIKTQEKPVVMQGIIAGIEENRCRFSECN